MMTKALGLALRRLPPTQQPTRSARTRTRLPRRGARRAAPVVHGETIGQLTPSKQGVLAKREAMPDPSARLCIQLGQHAPLRHCIGGEALVLASIFQAFVRETK